MLAIFNAYQISVITVRNHLGPAVFYISNAAEPTIRESLC
jgi:hypothetical protein